MNRIRNLHLRGVSHTAMMMAPEGNQSGQDANRPQLYPDRFEDHRPEWQNQQSQENNTGKTDSLPPNFWDDPVEEAPTGQQPVGNPNPAQGSSPQKTPQQQVDDYFASLDWGPEIKAEDLQGDEGLGNLNKTMQAKNQQAMRNMMGFFGESMKAFEQRMGKMIAEKLEGSFFERDSNAALESRIPDMANPNLRPVLQGVYSQALKHHKGDKSKAVEMTQAFLKEFRGGDDLSTPPGQPKRQSRESGIDWNAFFGG